MSNAKRSRADIRFVHASSELERGRRLCAERAWADAYRSLCIADGASPLEVEDLERLATSAYLIGREDEYLKALERAHHAYQQAGEKLRAVRCAFWMGLCLAFRGEMGPASGWFARAHRLLEREQQDCVEQGYLLLPVVEQKLAAGDRDAAYAAASGAAEIGERFGDAELLACARHLQGRVRLLQGRAAEGLGLLDEAMVAVTADNLSPIMTGLIYCSVIEACQQAYALARAREWTSALAQWCSEQPQLVSFTGACLVHRAEIMQLSGAWRDAIEEARRACERAVQANSQKTAGLAFYQQAEVHRLRGEFEAAEDAYREAGQRGWEPQPGLALLRLAQGRNDAAAAAMRRVLDATQGPLRRARLLPAHVEVMLAVGDIEEARRASRELADIAGLLNMDALRAMAAHAQGAIALAEGDARAALASLCTALDTWQEIEAPYEAARVRVLIGSACRALGDEDGATLQLESARSTFQQLGAASEIARLDPPSRDRRSSGAHGLTARELQVLRLVAAGKTNKAIANELGLSEKTIDRHVSNIFNKLDVSSRAAATASAYEHKLI